MAEDRKALMLEKVKARFADDLQHRLPLIFSWIGIVCGISLGIFLVYYLNIRSNLDRFCILGIAVMGFQFFGATVGGAWGKPALHDSKSAIPPTQPFVDHSRIRDRKQALNNRDQ